MIDQIFELIMKQASSRPGPDLILKLYNVQMEITEKISAAMYSIAQTRREVTKHESKTANSRRDSQEGQ